MKLNEHIVKGIEKDISPFYYYDLKVLEETLMTVKNESSKYNYKVHYAVKANFNPKIMRLISNYGFGADCVSGNEIIHALKMGFSSNDIVLAGVGKTDREIRLALENNIFCLNVESLEELKIINNIALDMGKFAPVALRLNPNINAKTHHYITTGLSENKFGIPLTMLDNILDEIQTMDNIYLKGLHFHIGSQITDLTVYEDLCKQVNEIQIDLEKRNINLDHINVGGGLGINYNNPDDSEAYNVSNYFALFDKYLDKRPNQSLHFEIGRSIVGTCGSLITKVLFVKKGIQTDFVVVDAGMTELIRPALYQSYHQINNLSSLDESCRYHVVGPICESSDCFGKNIILPKTRRGDIIAIRSAGAYGQVMSSRYNLRSTAPALYSDGTKVGFDDKQLFPDSIFTDKDHFLTPARAARMKPTAGVWLASRVPGSWIQADLC
ncbi:DgyrCDS3857 [Dimorphilus gyrociliatus]|uniref:DgyrCDS3857 n=1 Tax=Dimorphilus gyrociliatus TaxID=2664684 RepID=A0A7I8VF74_9ANNE|nr:DgyrCDS3857 [Dimorphilus gyrociliatus]